MKRLLFVFALLLLVPAAHAGTVEIYSHTFTAAEDDEDWSKCFDNWHAESMTVDCRGAGFGGGTVTWKVSVDGTNYATAQDSSGNITCTTTCTKQLVSRENGPYQCAQASLFGSTN